MLVSKSWFKPCHNSQTYALPGYVLVRNDRLMRRGGGVAIYLRNTIPFKTLSTSTQKVNGIEYLFLEIVVRPVLGVLYCAPTVDFVSSLILILDPLATDYVQHIIMGDFYTDLKDSQASRIFRSTIACFTLSLFELNATHHNIGSEDTWIDHAIVSSPELVVKHSQVPAPGFFDE